MFDGNGNWRSDFSAQADRDNGIKILASRFDNIFIADIKESFENCLTKDGQIAPIGNFNMGGQKITNVGNGTNDNDAVNKSQLDTKVDITGTQTITGYKTFAGDGWITKIQNTNITYNTAPSSDTATSLVFTDKNGKGMGFVECWRHTNNSTVMQINTYSANGALASNPIGLVVEANGNTWAYAPNSDANGSIVTTVNKSKAANGYFKLGNGLIVQWGYVSNPSDTLTFPTPFSNTNYSVTANYRKQSSSGSGIGHVNFYPTNKAYCYSNSQGGAYQWIAMGY